MPAKATGNNCFKSQPDINDWFETVKLNYGIDIKNGEFTTEELNPTPDETRERVYRKILDFSL